MAGKVSPTLKVLIEMRDELRLLRRESTDLRSELTQLRQETGERFEVLAAELTEVAHAVGSVRTLLADRLDVRDRVEDHELRLRALERQAG